MTSGAISQLSRRSKEAAEGDKELGRILNRIKNEGLLNVDGLLPKRPNSKISENLGFDER